MKTSHATAVIRLVVLIICASCAGTVRAQDPPVPVGFLSATPTYVQIGQKPLLSWNITHPALVKDIITITPPGTCTPKVKVAMDVRVIGAAVKVVWTNSWGQVTRWEWAHSEAQLSINNSTYTRIFLGTQDQVNPGTIVYSGTILPGRDINFGGRYYFDGWSTLFKSTGAGGNVVALANGDVPPTTTPLYQQPTIDDFIRQYLDGEGRVKIGPKDVIYLMELTHTNKYDGGFDLQDLALLVTFREVK
ncbi:MAG: hypothetical protein EOP87_02540 [Verrucomicrobiaceae bacterium]|nr:MAG: hypothetical protein EOP87_02540 [Verrucomicrobiaceae bacterium]